MREKMTIRPPINIRKAYTNNLKIDAVQIETNGILAVTGPSGSGKSSLIFDIIHRESQFRTLRALQSGVRPLEGLPEPASAEINELPPISALKQDNGILWPERLRLGDLAHIIPALRSLFIKYGLLHCPITNQPMLTYQPRTLAQKLINEHSNSRLHCLAPMRAEESYLRLIKELQRQGYARMAINNRVCLLSEAPPKEPKSWSLVVDRLKINQKNLDRLEQAIQSAYRAGNHTLIALIEEKSYRFNEKPYSNSQRSFYPQPSEHRLRQNHPTGWCTDCNGSGILEGTTCIQCKGSGLSPYAKMLKFGPFSFHEALSIPLSELENRLPEQPENRVLSLIHQYLKPLLDLNLGRLSLQHPARWLSSGERSRVRLSALLNTAMPGSLLLIDEPTLGLDKNACDQMAHYLSTLQEQHSMIIIDHHPAIWNIATHKLALGPYSGPNGGQIVKPNRPKASSVPFPSKRDRFHLKTPYWPDFIGYTENLNVVTGKSGSGKSRFLQALHDSRDQQSVFTHIKILNHVSRVSHARSCVATLAGIWTPIRELLAQTTTAKAQGFDASRFSFNTNTGRCETCKGLGTIQERYIGLPTFETTCSSCNGLRFDVLTRKVRYRNYNITDILALSIDEALNIFSALPTLFPTLSALSQIGLGHLILGQPSNTLSGGENRRLHIARTLGKAHRRGESLSRHLFLLDEPTAALHPNDCTTLLQTFAALCERGATFICATHEPKLISHANAEISLNS